MRTHARASSRLALLLLLATAAPAAGLVKVSPSSTSLTVGSARRLTAYVNGVPSARVAWSVNGVAGGNATVGTIDRVGRYVAPAVPPSGWSVTARAASLTNQQAFGTCAITVRHPAPLLGDVTPSSIPVGSFSLEVHGSGFVDGAQVLWNEAPLATTFVSSTFLRATGSATQTGTARVAVANPGPGSVSVPRFLAVKPQPSPTRTATMPPTATVRIEPTATNRRQTAATPGPRPARRRGRRPRRRPRCGRR